MENEENILGKEKIGKLIRKFSIPCIISLLVNSLYNIVDQIFIGWGVGYLGNGATNVVFPLTMICIVWNKQKYFCDLYLCDIQVYHQLILNLL